MPSSSQPPMFLRPSPSPTPTPSGFDRSHPADATPQFSVTSRDRRVRFDSSPLSHRVSTYRKSSTGQSASESRIVDDDLDGREDDTKPELGILLAITALKNRVGCCYYDRSGNMIHFLQDQQDGQQWDLVRMVLEQTQPSHVITSTNADSRFHEVLEQVLATLPDPSATSSSSSMTTSGGGGVTSTDGEGTTASDSPIRLEYRPAREFYAGQGKNALLQLNIVENGMYADGSDDGDSDPDADLYGAANSTRDSSTGTRTRPSNAYDFQSNKRAKTQSVRYDDERMRRQMGLRLEGFLNSLGDSPLTLGCAGALLGHISKQLSDEGELGSDVGLTITSLRLMQLDRMMLLNSEALTSLQIFRDESHASTHSSAKKEGLSLFGIMNLARTGPGRALLRTWFLRPLLDMEMITGRQNAVECFLRAENQHIADAIQSNLKRIKNAPAALRALGAGRGGSIEWNQILQFINGSITIRDVVLSLAHRKGVPIVEKCLNSFSPQVFEEIGGKINDTVRFSSNPHPGWIGSFSATLTPQIDWDESSAQKIHVIIRPGIDMDLDELRRTYNGLSSLLSKIAQRISLDLDSSFVQTLSVVYFPQLGYLIVVPYTEEVIQAENYGPVGWSFQVTYIPTSSVRFMILSTLVQSSRPNLRRADKEIQIAQDLLTRLREHETTIIATAETLTELDCLLSFAECARLYDWTRPSVVEEPVLDIRGGRHPLVELCVDSFVRNDVRLVGGAVMNTEEEARADSEDNEGVNEARRDSSVMVVTGANFSGKSVYLKQVAIITFMAHLGSFVPCEQATIGLTDRLLTRVSTRESIARGSSAFMIDCQQIAYALRNATPRSLLLLDEFGKGTESNDGAGLFCATLQHLVDRGPQAPRTLAATHFHSVFANDLLSDKSRIGFAHMQIIINDSTVTTSRRRNSVKGGRTGRGTSSSGSTCSAEVTYLFKVTPGLSLNSHAAACASLFGVDDRTIERAIQVTELIQKFEIATLVNEALTEEEADDLRESELIARRFLEWDLESEGWDDVEVDEVRQRVKSLSEGL
ncbi:BZ3500_MvSof-1268-A1-R1_Chr1-2g01313 [Microbotryum saponariae]|uniref:BZ3500_MvSof-1268-A1-R1_Chr1-2g01313 protein n=1 Tax=Microbotryum saponariae TaxID=289078 RepID=A0A2X0L6B8_9BASI|nr:BZ3500_MvSof-1268-A1-R1_Chr1-2g01313 [Microbotryum saponariae]SCZ97066.1 BZ3501_MvSof-1269-A2-R1_Chr1-2g00912 [Microbotryum saponariae]